MTKILLTGSSDSLNNGGMAMALSTADTLKKFIPDAKFSILSSCFSVDSKRYAPYNINVIERAWRGDRIRTKQRLLRLIMVATLTSITLFNCILWRIFFNKILKQNKFSARGTKDFVTSDIIIDISGDSLTEDYGFPIGYEILLGIITGKIVVIYAQSIGPFRNRLTQFLMKLILNRVNLITTREVITKRYLQEVLGINSPRIYLTAESAFLLKPASDERINKILLSEGINPNEKPLIGISPSRIIHRYGFPDCKSPGEKYQNYIKFMAKITDYMVEELNATVIFIPHVVAPNNDDRVVSYEIYQVIRNKHKVKLITSECTADELKGIIGICDMFIGCRMHATIASTSMHVPTIAIAYSHKTHGIIGEMLGQEKLVIDIRDFKSNDLLSELKSKIDYAWKNRDFSRNDLTEKMKVIQERALLNGKLVRDLLFNAF